MRLWSLHPRQLDRVGLVACWRETLLAQAVLDGRTRGYRHHPQLDRFRADPQPIEAIGAYLAGLAEEATARGYRFDAAKILRPGSLPQRMTVTGGQLELEWTHLGVKLAARSPEDAKLRMFGPPIPHPIFRVVPGPVEAWERTSN